MRYAECLPLPITKWWSISENAVHVFLYSPFVLYIDLMHRFVCVRMQLSVSNDVLF